MFKIIVTCRSAGHEGIMVTFERRRIAGEFGARVPYRNHFT
jgi:hypothetical protein